jgi:hypothetical protein
MAAASGERGRSCDGFHAAGEASINSGVHDAELQRAIDRLREAVEPLRTVAASIGWPEPVRDRVDRQIRTIEEALAVLERIHDENHDELV